MLYKNSLKYYGTRAFTLVELIVVITILAILATIGFVSYQSYTTNARDSKRTADIAQLASALEVYVSKGLTLPQPAKAIAISASGSVFMYQGYADSSVLSKIGMSEAKDPTDAIDYTYAMMPSGQYQVLGYTETPLSFISTSYAAGSDYSSRYIFTKGNQLGILLQSGTLVPAQDASTNIDILTSSAAYVSVLTDSNRITGTGGVLAQTNPTGSCRRILETGGSHGTGIYTINPYGGNGYSAYCDMTMDGGGWMLTLKASESGLTTTNIGISDTSTGNLTNITTTGVGTSGWYNLNTLPVGTSQAIAKCIAPDNTFIGIKFPKYTKVFAYNASNPEGEAYSAFTSTSSTTWNQDVGSNNLLNTSINGNGNWFYIGHDANSHHLCSYHTDGSGYFGEVLGSNEDNAILGVNGITTISNFDSSNYYRPTKMILVFTR